MEYKLERLREFAKTNLKPASDLSSFMSEIDATRTGDVIISDDRIRFSTANKVFRIVDAAMAEMFADRLEDYYDECPEAPTIKRN